MTTTSESPTTAINTLWLAGSIAMPRPKIYPPFPAAFGNAATGRANGACPQPDVSVPLQVEPSMTETVTSARLPMKTVFVPASTPTARGPTPTETNAGVWPQPDVLVPLQVLPSITETVLSLVLVTYTV